MVTKSGHTTIALDDDHKPFLATATRRRLSMIKSPRPANNGNDWSSTVHLLKVEEKQQCRLIREICLTSCHDERSRRGSPSVFQRSPLSAQSLIKAWEVQFDRVTQVLPDLHNLGKKGGGMRQVKRRVICSTLGVAMDCCFRQRDHAIDFYVDGIFTAVPHSYLCQWMYSNCRAVWMVDCLTGTLVSPFDFY